MTDPEIALSVTRESSPTIRATTTDYKVGDHYLVFKDEDTGNVRLINHDDIRSITVSE